MNERIRELALQAGYVPLEPCTFADDLQDIFLKKFAELIVRECVEIANKQFTAASGLDDRDCWTAGEMKKRFGVEP